MSDCRHSTVDYLASLNNVCLLVDLLALSAVTSTLLVTVANGVNTVQYGTVA